MLHYITVYYMFRLSKINHHQVLPALVIHEQCAEILLVWGGSPTALVYTIAFPHALTFNFQKRDLVPPLHTSKISAHCSCVTKAGNT